MENLLQKVKMLLGAECKEDIAEFAFEEACEIIRNYCGIDEVPQGLYTTAVRMAVDIYRNEGYGTETVPRGTVTSVSIGDASTSFSVNTEFNSSILKNYRESLRRYRKVVFE